MNKVLNVRVLCFYMEFNNYKMRLLDVKTLIFPFFTLSRKLKPTNP